MPCRIKPLSAQQAVWEKIVCVGVYICVCDCLCIRVLSVKGKNQKIEGKQEREREKVIKALDDTGSV